MRNKKGAVIAIVGPHYSGKSTLAKKMAGNGFCSVPEKWLDDPFKQFRKNGDYLKSQVWFLIQTMQTLLESAQIKEKGNRVVLDTFPYTTRSFCRSKLNDKDFKTFNLIFETVIKDFPLPDLIIYLTANSKTLLERSQARAGVGNGPASDREANEKWIKKTILANEVEFTGWQATPIIRINTSKKDVINNEENYQELLSQIAKYV